MSVAYQLPNANQQPTCDCSYTAIRWRIRSNGVGAHVVQCLTCGREIRAISKNAPEVRALVDIPIPSFDETLRDAWDASVREYWQQRRAEQQQAQESKTTAWWTWYTGYLKTPEWNAKRRIVLQRAQGRCEGCGKAGASQVHHLTYAHAGDEFLFELVAICTECHARIHPHME